jgi:hypothetical protein
MFIKQRACSTDLLGKVTHASPASPTRGEMAPPAQLDLHKSCPNHNIDNQESDVYEHHARHPNPEWLPCKHA